MNANNNPSDGRRSQAHEKELTSDIQLHWGAKTSSEVLNGSPSPRAASDREEAGGNGIKKKMGGHSNYSVRGELESEKETTATASTSHSARQPLHNCPNEPKRESKTPQPKSQPLSLPDNRQQLQHQKDSGIGLAENWSELSDAWEENIGKPGRKKLHNFFYPPGRQNHPQRVLFNSASHEGSSREVDGVGSTQQNKKSSNILSPEVRDAPTAPQASSNTPQPGSSSQTPRTLLEDGSAPAASSSAPSWLEGSTPLPAPETRSSPGMQRAPTTLRRQTTSQSPPNLADDDAALLEERQDREYVEKFWTAYDDFVILSLFSQLGILCRLGAAYWFRVFDAVFRNGQALFTNLPLNCLACFVMGILSSGESVMQIISTRFTPPRLQQDIYKQSQHDGTQGEDLMDGDFNDVSFRSAKVSNPMGRPRRRVRLPARRGLPYNGWKSPDGQGLQDELREVQLLALERRIRSSPCLVLFAVKKEDVDVVENYFNDGYCNNSSNSDDKNGHMAHSNQHRGNRQRRRHSEEEKIEEQDEDELPFEPGFSLEDHDLALEIEMHEDEEVRKCVGECRSGDRNNLDVKDDAKVRPRSTPEHLEGSLAPVESSETATPASSSTGRSALASSETPYSQTQLTLQGVPTAEIKLENMHDPPIDAASDARVVDPTELSTSRGNGHVYPHVQPNARALQYGRVTGGNVVDYGDAEHADLDLIISNVATDVVTKVSRIRRARLADGWDVGTSPEEMSDDLMLGLRIGFCGAISSFSSWMSSMVDLLRSGEIGELVVGLVLGIQLPIVAYRFGQHVAVYVFIWRCRRETRRDERRGYGIRLSMDDHDENSLDDQNESIQTGDLSLTPIGRNRKTKGRRTVQEEDSEVPSVRAIITAIFIMSLVAQVTSLSFFYNPEDRLVALSLLFSGLGTLTRWRLSKLNSWRPNFPIGTFACNIAACALSGTLGDLLSGNPGPRERILLVSIISGFGGTLSSVAGFIVEVLNGVDPILFRMDGVYYAVSSVFWGMLISFLFTASVDWADDIGKSSGEE